ncbi:unnamed protein product [Symbiodinium necroappetens]|uniref:Uncharacterized protein n=1 Tax=Symbiodinium necroappetens TaxID=1628268 RepID=A0A812ZBY9_9DINO|nr:unnamed protein product [Symbiodinium necroappetens]
MRAGQDNKDFAVPVSLLIEKWGGKSSKIWIHGSVRGQPLETQSSSAVLNYKQAGQRDGIWSTASFRQRCLPYCREDARFVQSRAKRL